MKQTVLMVCAVFLLTALNIQLSFAQPPIRYYPLDNGSARENINRKDGLIKGQMTPCADRFGRENGAMQLFDNSYISTPNFFEGSTYSNGFTISFWTYIDKNFSKRKGVSPWEETDSIYRMFYAMNPQSEIMLGFYHRRDRAVLDRYVINQESNVANYGIWFWDPLNFTNKVGWCQVFLVYRTNSMTVYVIDANGRMEAALHYFGLQNLTLATEWGLGGKVSHSVIMDDFKVYAQVLSEEDVKILYSKESVPNGMYTVTSAPNLATGWVAENGNTAVGTLIDVYNMSFVGQEYSRQWVFEPVEGKPNVCRIRMAYTDRYLAVDGIGTNENVKLDFLYSNNEWQIEMTGDGYFFVRSDKKPNVYMKSVARPFTSVRMLQTDTYKATEAPYYKWRFNLMKLHYDLAKNDFIPKMGYEVINNANPVYGLIPQRPFTSESSPLFSDRDTYPSLSNHYTFSKNVDDSYVIYSKTYPTKAMHPESRLYSTNHIVELNEWHSGWDTYYKFRIEKPNPLGRKVQFIPIRAQSLSVYSGDEPTQTEIVFKTIGQGLEDGHYWQIYRDDGQLNRNKQISTISPGIYKISTLLDGNRSLCPAEYSFYKGDFLLLRNFNEEKRSCFYWIVDYERDMHGLPVRDGSYMIQLLGTDAAYMGSSNRWLPEGSTVQNLEMNRDLFALSKWFVEPTRDGTGSYFIRSAYNKLKYLHCYNASGAEQNRVEYRSEDLQTEQKAYKWKFESVTIPTPLAPGTYHIKSASQYYVHTMHDSTEEGADLELGELGGGTYAWEVELNADNTYSIYVKGSYPKMYVHTDYNRTDASAPLQIDEYNAQHAFTYRWLVTKKEGEDDTYYLQLVGNPYEGYMHLFSHNLTFGTPLEIYRYVDVVDNVYTWKFEKIE